MKAEQMKPEESREAYIEKLKAQLDRWNAEIEKLKARAGQIKSDVKLGYEKQMKDLEEKHKRAGEKLEELRRADAGAWRDLKAGIENTWQTLGDSIRFAVSRFK